MPWYNSRIAPIWLICVSHRFSFILKIKILKGSQLFGWIENSFFFLSGFDGLFENCSAGTLSFFVCLSKVLCVNIIPPSISLYSRRWWWWESCCSCRITETCHIYISRDRGYIWRTDPFFSLSFFFRVLNDNIFLCLLPSLIFLCCISFAFCWWMKSEPLTQ